MYALNSFSAELNASFEFPQSSIHEDFEVYLDGTGWDGQAYYQTDDKVTNLQSLDELGTGMSTLLFQDFIRAMLQ